MLTGLFTKLRCFATGLRGRLVMASLVVEVAMMAALIGNNLRLIDENLQAQAERRIAAIELAYKTAVSVPMITRDYATLRDVIDGLRQGTDINYIVVTDTSGVVLAASGLPADQSVPSPDAPSQGDMRPVRFGVDVMGQTYGHVHYGLNMAFLKEARSALLAQGTAIAGLALVISAVLLYAVGFWLTRHLTNLANASDHISQGNYGVKLPYTSSDEVGQLTQNFNRMAEAVQARVSELADHLTRQKVILQALGEGIYGVDPDGRCTFINPAALEMLGYTEEEVVGSDTHSLFHHSHPDGSTYHQSDCPVSLTQVDGQDRRHEDWLWHKDGHGFPVSMVTTPLVLKGESHGTVVSFWDISASRAAALALKESLDQLTAFAHALPDIVVVKDGQSRWQMMNHAAEDALQLKGSAWQGKCNAEMALERPAYKAFHEAADASDQLAWAHGDVSLSIEHIHAAGEVPRICEVRKIPVFADNGSPKALMVIARDITERIETEQQLRKLSLAVEQSPESIVITDLMGHIEYVNTAFVNVTGYTLNEALGQNPRILKSDKTPPETHIALWEALTAGNIWRGEFINKRKDGAEYIESATIAPVREADGRVSHYLAIKQDITEHIRTKERVHKLAFTDNLTGLANRAMLLERLEVTLAYTKRQGTDGALILFNLDRFRNLNDARGHRLGDLFLVAVGDRLGSLLGTHDTLARVTADEFAILLTWPDTAGQTASRLAMALAEQIHAALRQPFVFGDEASLVTASLGITLLPQSMDDTPQEVLRRADTALHRAKHAGGNQSAFFDVSMGELTQQRFRTENELRRGIAANELRLFLQRQVNASGKLVSAEALVRWQHPERGLLAPGAFIPIAEESDLIIELENWVMRETCRHMAREEMAGQPLHVSVNVSPRHFRQTGFVNWLIGLLAQEGNDPAYLTLEITEGMVIDDIDELIGKMNRLAQMGIHFSIDDFGTGYSSLAYLKRLPIDELKIDKSFVQDAPTDPDDGALVQTILSIASNLHLKVVAEGVETPEQAQFLNDRAEVIHQGYLFGRPEQAEIFLQRRRAEIHPGSGTS
jgi:diguanylate cyclase (GGDEF)-like protein/PAS domain S-box-containing protein